MYDLHIHSIFSDGELIPAEIARRCSVLGHKAIAITDHADNSNLEFILTNLVPACEELNKHVEIEVIPGIEITHVPPRMLEDLVGKARKLGAKLLLIHGETPAEPVIRGTNLSAVKIPRVDILAHPGFVTMEEAELARENGIYLELTSRRGHCIANGHIAKVAQEAKADLLVNTDAHSPEDLITGEEALQVAMGSGLSRKNSEIITSVNPRSLLDNI
jgi:histidinol phosphatase-like PHP family hydrolase